MAHAKTLWKPKGNTWEPRDQQAARIIRKAKPEEMPPRPAPTYAQSLAEKIQRQAAHAAALLAANEEYRLKKRERRAAEKLLTQQTVKDRNPVGTLQSKHEKVSPIRPLYEFTRQGQCLWLCKCTVVWSDAKSLTLHAQAKSKQEAKARAATRILLHLASSPPTTAAAQSGEAAGTAKRGDASPSA